MTHPALERLALVVKADPNLRDRLETILAAPEAERPARIVKFSEEVGSPVTPEELATLVDGELSPEDLEQVAGGIYLGKPDPFEEYGMFIGRNAKEFFRDVFGIGQ